MKNLAHTIFGEQHVTLWNNKLDRDLLTNVFYKSITGAMVLIKTMVLIPVGVDYLATQKTIATLRVRTLSIEIYKFVTSFFQNKYVSPKIKTETYWLELPRMQIFLGQLLSVVMIKWHAKLGSASCFRQLT